MDARGLARSLESGLPPISGHRYVFHVHKIEKATLESKYHIWCNHSMNGLKQLPARFFEQENGNAPVRNWLLSLSPEDRKMIGDDIRTAEFGWPVGMPLCRSIKGQKGLWEIRINLDGGRIARVFFCAYDSNMILLHGFIKKTRETPDKEIAIAVKRMKGLI